MDARKTKETEIVLSAGHLRILAGARTQDVWSCFDSPEPLSAADVQRQLGLESKTVYYQLGKLVQAGLLVVEEGQGRASRYSKAAAKITIPDGFQGIEFERQAARMVAAKIRHAQRQFLRTAGAAETDPDIVDWLYVHSNRVQVSKANWAAFKKEFLELLAKYEKSPDAQGTAVRLLMVGTPELE